MATRAAIGVYTNQRRGQWRGTYSHWDGYPSGLGKALWDIYHKHYRNILPAMVEYLIDAHPEGWSIIVGRDFSQRPTWLGLEVESGLDKGGVTEDKRPPLAYKYRGEEPAPMDETSDFGHEWAYVFDLRTNTMTVLKCQGGYNERMHYRKIATVPLDGTEPDWESFR